MSWQAHLVRLTHLLTATLTTAPHAMALVGCGVHLFLALNSLPPNQVAGGCSHGTSILRNSGGSGGCVSIPSDEVHIRLEVRPKHRCQMIASNHQSKDTTQPFFRVIC